MAKFHAAYRWGVTDGAGKNQAVSGLETIKFTLVNYNVQLWALHIHLLEMATKRGTREKSTFKSTQ